MSAWFRFFLGTPRRFATTATVIGLIVVTLRPGLLAVAAHRLAQELSPLLGPALAILIVLAGINLILFGRRRR